MPRHPRIAMQLSDDRTVAHLTTVSQPEHSVDLTAVELEAAARAFIACRADMLPARYLDNPIGGTPVLSARQMRWWISGMDDGIQVCLLHPGLGWIGIPLDKEGAKELKATILGLVPD